MKTLVLPALCLALLGVAACSVFVQADLSKVKDDMYMPTDAGAEPDAGADAGPDASDEEDSGVADAGPVTDAGEADGG
jgi:hypothetical protein